MFGQKPKGSVFSDTVILNVTSNLRPELELTLLSKNTYQAGDTIVLAGTGYDPENGSLEAYQLNWKVDFYHDNHYHPLLKWTLGDSLRFVAPTFGEIDTNVWFRIYLQGTDESGLSNTVQTDIFPELVTIALETQPNSLQGVNADGEM